MNNTRLTRYICPLGDYGYRYTKVRKASKHQAPQRIKKDLLQLSSSEKEIGKCSLRITRWLQCLLLLYPLCFAHLKLFHTVPSNLVCEILCKHVGQLQESNPDNCKPFQSCTF